jgi:hypothetical protein
MKKFECVDVLFLSLLSCAKRDVIFSATHKWGGGVGIDYRPRLCGHERFDYPSSILCYAFTNIFLDSCSLHVDVVRCGFDGSES